MEFNLFLYILRIMILHCIKQIFEAWGQKDFSPDFCRYSWVLVLGFTLQFVMHVELIF